MICTEVKKHINELAVLNELSQNDIDKMHLINTHLQNVIPGLTEEFYLNAWREDMGMNFPELDETAINQIFQTWITSVFSCPTTAPQKYTEALWTMGELHAQYRLAPLVIASAIPFMTKTVKQCLVQDDSALPYTLKLELAASLLKTLEMNESILYDCVA
ncbi:protoglobin domain-containing protein [Wohlfahrtiimonas chitiniclastica]|uniref:protoglobin domain-containing protein n=1 Tax=Wohlfahrtiimonas chitiniclastica TaxID=400946 RepID=UPI0007B69B9A|nr:protoglobin domain-containing protein [Wohlfahrtiimonas chitiniclastica]KZX36464.1 hypothetical protein A6V30_08715 [Wohlfahrtiimonas chitiniclastica]